MAWEFLWRNKNTLSLSFCILFSLISILWQRNPFALGLGMIGKAGDRVSGALNSGLKLPGNIWVQIDQYRELEKRYSAAQKQLEDYRLEKDRFDRLKQDNDLLRKQMNFQPLPNFPEVKAEVLGVRLNSISPRLIINRGSSDGIKPMMPVICRASDQNGNTIQAVVGMVASSDSRTSIVQLLYHPGFEMGVRLPGHGQWAILSGNSGSLTSVLLTYINDDKRPETNRQAGGTKEEMPAHPSSDPIVYTSGDGGVFPPGIPVGVLDKDGPRQGEMRTIFVRPFADIASLDVVSVIIKSPEPWRGIWERDARWGKWLSTEFGSPEFSEQTDTERFQKPKVKTKQETLPQTNTEQPTEESDTLPDEETEKNKPVNQPRRIQNVIPQKPAGAN